ncbi:unnamed protein product [Brachionus calyciflorus]|uniref:Phospholipase A2-like central domain-containing protein n=1 Tax=Brachionus calyciflorus TaxID=104777 RepID=A0A813V4G6_9BILA|nr:unnamed protein product [Brachionus calyciflorus]
MKTDTYFQLIFLLISLLKIGSVFTRRRVISKRDTWGFFISHGTKWCGMGNVASDCDELGEHAETDNCCREHDSCPYTFGSNFYDSFNGYTSHYMTTISHCECDLIFFNCLHEKPYKAHSYEIWTQYETLNIKCFSYMPCNEKTDEYDNIWKQKGSRDTGECSNGTRVMVFESINDYLEFTNENIRLSQMIEINKKLITDHERFDSKTKYKCAHSFPKIKQKLADNFESEFLNGNQDYVKLKNKSKKTNKLEILDEINQIVQSPNFISVKNSANNTKDSISTSSPAVKDTIKIENVFKSLNENDFRLKSEPKTIFLSHVVIPMVLILAIFAFLKFLINLYDNDNL